MFFIPETEDYFFRTRPSADIAMLQKAEESAEKAARARFNETYANPPGSEATS